VHVDFKNKQHMGVFLHNFVCYCQSVDQRKIFRQGRGGGHPPMSGLVAFYNVRPGNRVGLF